jgi:hypothetical protein
VSTELSFFKIKNTLAMAQRPAAAPDMHCPISAAIMRDPVSTIAGRTYERTSIEQWWAHQRAQGLACTDPMTGEVVSSTTLVPDQARQRIIESWRASCTTAQPTIVETDLVFGDILGLGSFGVARSATWQGLSVAVTILTVDASEVKDAPLQAFSQKTSALCELNHPNIARFFGVCRRTADNCLLLVQEPAALGSLAHRLYGPGNPGPLPVFDLVRFAVDVARGLVFAHSQGIAHNDVRSDNCSMPAVRPSWQTLDLRAACRRYIRAHLALTTAPPVAGI